VPWSGGACGASGEWTIWQAARGRLEKNTLFQTKSAKESLAVRPASNQRHFP